MDYYISDTHFGHANIIRFTGRPFDSVEEMDKALIANWNARVGPDDHVWHLGDFGYRNSMSAANYLAQLNGHKHLIIGNHDHKSLMRQVDLDTWFETVAYATSRTDAGNRRIWMSHYPLLSPPKRIWCLYGHVHNDRDAAHWPLLRNMDMALNCCVEVNNYMPVTFEELLVNNERWKRG